MRKRVMETYVDISPSLGCAFQTSQSKQGQKTRVPVVAKIYNNNTDISRSVYDIFYRRSSNFIY